MVLKGAPFTERTYWFPVMAIDEIPPVVLRRDRVGVSPTRIADWLRPSWRARMAGRLSDHDRPAGARTTCRWTSTRSGSGSFQRTSGNPRSAPSLTQGAQAFTAGSDAAEDGHRVLQEGSDVACEEEIEAPPGTTSRRTGTGSAARTGGSASPASRRTSPGTCAPRSADSGPGAAARRPRGGLRLRVLVARDQVATACVTVVARPTSTRLCTT